MDEGCLNTWYFTSSMLPFFSFSTLSSTGAITPETLKTYAQFIVGTQNRGKAVRAFWLTLVACLFLRRLYERQPLLYAAWHQRVQEYSGTMKLNELFGIQR